MRYTYLAIFFLIGLRFSVAQSNKIEVLKQRLVNAKTENEKADLNFQLAESLYSYSFDEGYKYADEAFRISENSNYEKGKVQALTSLGNYYYYKGESKKSLEFYYRAIALAKNLSLHDFPSRTYLRLSIYYRQQANFDSAQLYLNKIKDLLPTDGKSSMLASYYASAGIIKVAVNNGAGKVLTNEYLCRIFLENIIENSIDFCTPLNPTLSIVTSQSEDNFTIIIEDNGQGIPATIQHRIFEMYFRGNDNSKGNGLGLYIAKRAIDKIGGTISFISRLHEGTSFKITLSNRS